MCRINFAALILLHLLCLQLESPAQSQVKGTKPGTSTISGQVTYKGEPLSGVTVSILPSWTMGPTDPNSLLSARTDQNGKYRITGVSAGRYLVNASAAGFGVVGDRPNTGLDLNIAEGENVENIDIELKRGGVITGRITDSSNRPLVEERVELMRFNQNDNPQPFYFGFSTDVSSTDDRGIYRLYGLPAGRYLVSVGVSQTEGAINVQDATYFPKTFYPGTTDQSQAKVVEVGEGSEATDIDITVAEARKSYDIYGRVISAENGQPVAGVGLGSGSFSADGQRLVSWGSRGDRSNAKGEFHLQGLLPGKVGIFAVSDQESAVISDVEVCEIGNSDIHGVEIRVRQGGSIGGLVVIEGTSDQAVLSKIPGIELNAFARSNVPGPSGRNSARVDSDGSFRIKGLRPGKVGISLWGVNPLMVRGLSILRIERGGVPVSQQDGIEVGPGENISNVRVVLGYGSLAIHGEVKITGGTLPPDLKLYVSASVLKDGQRTGGSGAEVDRRRQFVIENLLPGEYELRLSPIYWQPGVSLDSRLSTAIVQVRQKVVVGYNSQPLVSLVIDLSQQEGNR